jgi:predicted helicase
VNGEPLGEKNPKWLQDDYVKFLRFAQWKIQTSDYGIVGMITNHSYLDNPTFRGMRQSLMKTFDEIYILDLHGNSLKKETTPEGGKDENVFDIRQGVAIALFVRNEKQKESQVFHTDLYGLRECKYDWLNKNNIVLIHYRPFDIRYTYYTGKSRGFLCMPRPEVMRHMLKDNIGLITTRQFKEEPGAFVAENIIGHKTVSVYDINYLFPLYIYPEDEKDNLRPSATMMMVFEPRVSYGRKPNIAPIIFEKLETAFGKRPTSEDIFYYIYGVFYSNIYRETYTEFLKIDFPRVPFTANYELFKKMGKLGRKLTDLHLLKEPAVDPPVAKYPSIGANDRIEKIIYKKNEQRVYINGDKYFEGITPEVWNYHIGGYQVLHKYLKDRKGRMMDDSAHYCKIVTALSKTMEIQKKIDEIYPEIEKDLIYH